MLGEQIKVYRKKMELTLKKMAELTDLSTGYISNIERGLTSPTVENLQNICDVLRVNLVDLFINEEKFEPLVKKEERGLISIDEEGIYQSLTDKRHSIYGTCLIIREDYDKERIFYIGNEYEQFGIVIKGIFEITIRDKTYVCHEGDTIFIEAKVPYRYHKVNKGECVSYWCLASRTYIEDK